MYRVHDLDLNVLKRSRDVIGHLVAYACMYKLRF